MLLAVSGAPSGGNPPPPQHLESVAFDRQRGKLVLYGGAAAQNGALTEFTAVHEWDPRSGWSTHDAPAPAGASAPRWCTTTVALVQREGGVSHLIP